MPEGDTIFRSAATLHRVLAGRLVVHVESAVAEVRPARLVNHRITSVASRGKWLLIHFDHGLVLLTHMRMHGSWHTYPRGERWRRPRTAMRLVIATDEAEAVAFDVPVIELREERELSAHPSLSRLGPDLLAHDVDLATAVANLRRLDTTPVAEALLAQRALAGIGNVFKSEILFLCGVHPLSPVSDLSDGQLRTLVGTGIEQLRANVRLASMRSVPGGGFRRTTDRMNPGERLWVYGRAGRPCRRCGTTIASAKTGLDARLTYWCPACQATNRDSGVGIRDS